MEPEIEIFPTPLILAEEFALKLLSLVDDSVKQNETFTIALSGGSTPELLFDLLGEKYAGKVSWENVHFFWGDERCVPPDNSESNYGMAYKKMLARIKIPASNIHRIKGEDNPEHEAIRYSEEISSNVNEKNKLPSFDLIILGLGEDGHTASIFPGNPELLVSGKICEVAVHPTTKQKRITLTGKVLNNAAKVFFLVTGTKKAGIIVDIFKRNPVSYDYPASYINPLHGVVMWYLDDAAASQL